MTDQELFNSISARLEHARTKHPLFARSRAEAADVIGSEMNEFDYAVEHEDLTRQKDEALDVIATCCRFVLGEWGGDLGAKKKGPSQAGQTGQKRKWSRPQDQEGF